VFVSIAVAIGAVLLAIKYLWPGVLTLMIGGITYYIFSPIVHQLARLRVPRWLTTLTLTVVLFLGLAFALSRLVPRIYTELSTLLNNVPQYAASVEAWLIDQKVIGEDADPRLRDAVATLSQRAQRMAFGGADWVLRRVFGLFGSLSSLFLGLIVGIYLLIGAEHLSRALPSWIPPEPRGRWVRFGRAANRVVSGYVRARILASVFVGISYWIAFALLGVNQALLLAVIGGILNFVPILGPLLAAIPAMFVSAFQGLGTLLGVVVVQIVAQQIESSIIEPLIAGRAVRLPPVAIVLVVAFGLAFAGIPGMLVAVPLGGVVRSALDIFYRERWTKPAD
jgi:predicted PurR-regulated permease PerM